MFPCLALSTVVWERGMGGRRGRWGRTSKCVQLRTWAAMIKNRDCLQCTSHMGPLLPLPLDFLSLLPISLDEITVCPGLLMAAHSFTLLVAATLSFVSVLAQDKYIPGWKCEWSICILNFAGTFRLVRISLLAKVICRSLLHRLKDLSVSRRNSLLCPFLKRISVLRPVPFFIELDPKILV